MRNLIGKSAAVVIVPLAVALAAPGPAAAVPVPAHSLAHTGATAEAGARTAAAAPVRIQVSYPSRVRAGRTVSSYKVKLVNNLRTRTDEIFFAVKFPKNASKVRIYVPKNSRYREKCTRELTRALCVLPGLKKGKSYTFWAKVWVKGSARGKLYGYFGGAVVDTPLNTDPAELMSEFGSDIRWVKTGSTIVR
ncbi:hypothetical protein [Sphaerimonospora mesophila]|uniref:hypothetical protein n=1 Tax=Sphaerimonospora mesophila TaxID=37483 RepID=UPI000AEFF606